MTMLGFPAGVYSTMVWLPAFAIARLPLQSTAVGPRSHWLWSSPRVARVTGCRPGRCSHLYCPHTDCRLEPRPALADHSKVCGGNARYRRRQMPASTSAAKRAQAIEASFIIYESLGVSQGTDPKQVLPRSWPLVLAVPHVLSLYKATSPSGFPHGRGEFYGRVALDPARECRSPAPALPRELGDRF